MSKTKTFPATLKALIDKSDLSVTAWAKANGFPQQTIEGYTAGRRKPTWEMVQRLAQALGVSTDTFRDQSTV
jgi:plasmid maintenance system antidote protein VapI